MPTKFTLKNAGDNSTSSEEEKKTTTVIHGQHEDIHSIVIDYLRVLIVHEDDYWFAQGLEVDYAASGSSLSEVKERFAHGLEMTTYEHLKMHGDIVHLLKIAPQEAWQPLLSHPKAFTLSISTFHDLSKNEETPTRPQSFPFSKLAYYEPSAAA